MGPARAGSTGLRAHTHRRRLLTARVVPGPHVAHVARLALHVDFVRAFGLAHARSGLNHRVPRADRFPLRPRHGGKVPGKHVGSHEHYDKTHEPSHEHDPPTNIMRPAGERLRGRGLNRDENLTVERAGAAAASALCGDESGPRVESHGVRAGAWGVSVLGQNKAASPHHQQAAMPAVVSAPGKVCARSRSRSRARVLSGRSCRGARSRMSRGMGARLSD